MLCYAVLCRAVLCCAVLYCAERLARAALERGTKVGGGEGAYDYSYMLPQPAVDEVRGARLDGLIVPNRRTLRNTRYTRGSEIQQYEQPPTSLLQSTMAACTHPPSTSASVHSRRPNEPPTSRCRLSS
jgi:hypothetical protein